VVFIGLLITAIYNYLFVHSFEILTFYYLLVLPKKLFKFDLFQKSICLPWHLVKYISFVLSTNFF